MIHSPCWCYETLGAKNRPILSLRKWEVTSNFLILVCWYQDEGMTDLRASVLIHRRCLADTTKAWSLHVENKGIHSVCVVFCTWLPLVKTSAWVHMAPPFPSVYVLLTSKSCFKKSHLFIYTGRRRMLRNAGYNVAKSYVYPQWPNRRQRDSSLAQTVWKRGLFYREYIRKYFLQRIFLCIFKH